MMEWFEPIKTFLVENKEWIETLIVIITFIASGLGVLFGLILIPEDVKKARRYIKNISQTTKKQIKNEPIFFDEPNSKQYVFYKGMNFVNMRNQTISFRKIRRQSYVLSGEAGCGKSAFLKYDYLYHLRHNYIKRIGHIFLTQVVFLTILTARIKPSSCIIS